MVSKKQEADFPPLGGNCRPDALSFATNTKNIGDVDGIFCNSQFNHTSSMAHYGYSIEFLSLITREQTIKAYVITA